MITVDSWKEVLKIQNLIVNHKSWPVKSNTLTSFMSFYFFNTSFTNTDWSWLVCESIKALEIKISIVFNLIFANNTILLIILILLVLSIQNDSI